MKIPEILKKELPELLKELAEMSEEDLLAAHDLLVDFECHIEAELYLRDIPERVERADER